jgi:hypothetical protein
MTVNYDKERLTIVNVHGKSIRVKRGTHIFFAVRDTAGRKKSFEIRGKNGKLLTIVNHKKT